ncbi:MAG: cytochrome c biogenesis protein CcsA [Myxococcota bacterium]
MLILTHFAMTALFYGVACGLFFVTLSRGHEGLGRHAFPALLAGVMSHVVYVAVDLMGDDTPPMSDIHSTLTVLSLGIVLAFLFATWRKPAMAILGAFVTPVVLVFFLASSLGRSVAHVPAGVRSALLPIHIVVNIAGFAAFALSFAAALAYVVQERLLKQKRLGGIFQRLPPLHVLDTFGLRATSIGVPLLTFSIISGVLIAVRSQPGLASLGATQLFAVVAWLVFAGVLLLRLAIGWRGRRAALGTILGFVCVLAVLVGYVARAGGGA